MKISLIRGGFANPFELQNFYPLKGKYDITCFTSQKCIDADIDLPVKKLLSPTDLPNFPYKYSILNRILPDAHYLYGLESQLSGTDIAHVAETYYFYTLQAIKAREQGRVKKVVSTVWETIPGNNETLSGRKRIKEYTRPRIDHYLAVTQKAKHALVAEGVNPSKISVCPMGVDLSRFTPNKVNKAVKNLLFVGRLVPEKGIGETVNAFSQIAQKYPDISLTVVGTGPLKSIISHPRIFQKSVPYSDVAKIYQDADIIIAPSKATSTWEEQFGMVLVEAMACGIPIITTKTGAIPEVCGTVADYVPSSSAKDIATHLQALINQPQVRYNMSKAGLVRAKAHYDHRQVAKRISSIYEHL